MPTDARGPDLSDIWLFASCSAREQRAVRRALDVVTVRPGRVLCEEGEIGREFFVVVDGQASVRVHGRRVAVLGPGDHFGELALLDRRPRSATVTSETEMELLVLAQREFNALLDEVPALSRKLLHAMAGRLRAADSRAPALISH